VDIHTHQLVPRLDAGQPGHRQLKFPDRQLELLREQIWQSLVSGASLYPLVAGYSRVENNPEVVGNQLMAG